MASRRKSSAAGRNKPAALTLSTGSTLDRAATKIIRQGLLDFNKAMIGPQRFRRLWVVARDASGRVHAGLLAASYWEWLYVEWLWVDEAWRRRGTGSRLLRRAEQIARKRGCVGIFLDTFSFQAPDFYRKQGYKKFGHLAGLPPGHARIWFHKAL
jgi:GNAT superfamily N-acetyltransferase